jgi:eukaryotic-like serine/threonine-protein kinase
MSSEHGSEGSFTARWAQIDELLQSALAREPRERSAFLREACGSDTLLLREVESLLSSHERAKDFLEDPAPGVSPGGLTEGAPKSLLGCRIGPYEILALLGFGGMGEVYRAIDTRLNRSVAIKLLPARFSRNVELRERFEREARTVSSLSHPHICALYDIGSDGGLDYFVMENLEGQTLAERLKMGALPLEQALQYGIELADALSAAHRQGITHRDVKPGNIMVVKAGIKLLDFGLARTGRPKSPILLAGPAEGPGNDASTVEGTILGTFQYMSPEQLEGLRADARSDIFAFGAVLYEMLTGRKAYEGRSQASLIAAILSSTPAPVSRIQPVAPEALDQLVQRCLAQDPEDRWQSTSDIKKQLEWIAAHVSNPPKSENLSLSPRRRIGEVLAWGTAGLLAIALALSLGWMLFRSEDITKPAVFQFQVAAPAGAEHGNPFMGAPAISPDGSRVLMLVTRGGQTQWYVKVLNSVEPPQPIAGTTNAFHPFWKPDSSSIGFFSGGQLKIANVSGGVPTVLCDLGDPTGNQGKGGTWNRDGDIVFAATRSQPLYRVTERGGECKQVTKLANEEGSHMWPYFLPDGRHFIFFARGGRNAIYIGSLDSMDRKLVFENADWNVIYSPPGYLLFVDDENLMAQSFDPASLEKTGEPFRVTAPVAIAPNISRALFSTSDTGALVFYSASGAELRQLSRFDRKGQRLGILGPAAPYQDIRLSSDGQRLIHGRLPSSGVKPVPQLQVLDLRIGQHYLFNADIRNPYTQAPVWSAQPNRVFFSGRACPGNECPHNLYSATAGESRSLFGEDSYHVFPLDASRDGNYLLLLAQQYRVPDGKGQIWTARLRPEWELSKPAEKAYTEREGRFSPDGRLIAYTSDESGKFEVYVRSFPSGDRKIPISRGGGSMPVWRRDGREIVFLSIDRFLTSVTLNGSADDSVSVAKIEPLFQVPGVQLNGTFGVHPWWDMTPDGESFVIAEDQERQPLVVMTNWLSEPLR